MFLIITFITILRGKDLLLSGFKLFSLKPLFLVGESIYYRGFKSESLMTQISKYMPHATVINIQIFSNSFGLNKSIIKP